ncbi:MAG TPA: MFS transporter [Devosia sp.]|nr:MFS transporter [Devosia sp.]
MSLSRATAVSLLVAGAFFMENLDGTVIVTAIPAMAQSFGVHPVDLSIGVSAYILALAVLIPASGWMADRFGARTIFASAIVVFTLASVLCGFSTNLVYFTAARVLQGIGGAMMVPVGRLVVLRSARKEEIIGAIGLIVWPGLAAPVLGPPLGGFITTYLSWHWIFFLNVPLGAIALLLALRLVPQGETVETPFDWAGFLLTGIACFAVMLGIDLLSRDDPPLGWTALALVGGLAIGALAVWHSRREAHPLVDLYALRYKTFSVTVWGGTLFRASIGAVPFLLPLLFQIGFGLDPFVSGLLVLSVFAGNIVMKIFTTGVLNRFGFRRTLVVNGVLNAAAILACALITPQTPVPVIMVLLFISGLTRSMQFTTIATIAFADVPQERMSGANTLANVVGPMGMALGVALAAVALRIGALLFPAPGPAISLMQFHAAFVLAGLIALAGVADVIGLAPGAGDALRKPRQPRPADAPEVVA